MISGINTIQGAVWKGCVASVLGAAILLALPAVSMGVGTLIGDIPLGRAQAEEACDPGQRKTPAIRASIFAKLNQAQVALENELYDEALDLLSTLSDTKGLNSYERANLYNVYGAVYHRMADIDKALSSYKAVISEANIPCLMEEKAREIIARLEQGDSGAHAPSDTSSGSEGKYLPMVIVAPTYPNRAITQDVEGYCDVEYTVSQQGKTRDIKILECSPSGYFEQASLEAVKRYRYRPRLEDGEAVEVPGVQRRVHYKLNQ